jgi:hypothetical protein
MANKKDVKPDKKVQPSKKKKEEKRDDKKSLKDKATLMIMRHPELMNNARGLFRNENGKTIVEEMVPRGDLDTEEQIMPRNQGDLDDDDLRELALYASGMVDKDLLQYDSKVAFEDALQKAVWSKDDGRYQNRVNASTFQLILDNMKSMKKKASEEEEQDRQAQEEQPEEQSSVSDKSSSDAEENPEENSPGGVKEAKMDEALLKKEIAATRKRLAALQVLAGEEESEKEEAQEEGTSKEATETFECPKCGTKVLKKTGYCVKCKAKVKPKGSKEASEKTAAQKVAEQLDEIADLLESHDDPELMKLAYEIDEVSDSLDGKKTAAALESDSDEPYMKKYFRHGALEKDADEPYMKEFDEDISTELRNKQQKGQLGKEASMPYKIRKD